LKYFYTVIRDALIEILLLLDGIEALSLIIENIGQSVQRNVFLDPRTKAVFMKRCRICKASGEALVYLLKDLEGSMTASNKTERLEFALKNENIGEFQKRLERVKTTIFLANQFYGFILQKYGHRNCKLLFGQ
jgi:hypothetical protein